MKRIGGLLTIDLEDYRRQELRDHRWPLEPPHPREVERQVDRLLEVLGACGARATFFAVGRLAGELAHGAWREIADRHRVGCHGYEHLRIRSLGPVGFERDLRAAKAALEDATGQAVISYRAPYFSADGCDPWFGAALARAQIVLDSSRRLRSIPPGFEGTLPLLGSGDAVREVPLPAIGFGSKRLAILGGTYFRLLPLPWIIRLLQWGQARGFIPMVYLHPYDFDPTAARLSYDRLRQWRPYLGDQIRLLGRTTTAEKFLALSDIYDFKPIESLISRGTAEPDMGESNDFAAHDLRSPSDLGRPVQPPDVRRGDRAGGCLGPCSPAVLLHHGQPELRDAD